MREPYFVVVERDDGTTFTQKYYEFEQLVDFVYSLGSDYLVVDIYG